MDSIPRVVEIEEINRLLKKERKKERKVLEKRKNIFSNPVSFCSSSFNHYFLTTAHRFFNLRKLLREWKRRETKRKVTTRQ